MLTPAFELSQDYSVLAICIRIPYSKAVEKYVHFEDHDFTFYCKPYHLRLNLPGKVVYEEEPDVSYDVDKGTLTVKMKKVNPGEEFEGLDMITKFLAPKKKPPTSAPLIEVVGDTNCEEEFDEFDWLIEQTSADDSEILFLGNPNCGFANLHSCHVFKLKEETGEIFDIVDPETKPAHVLHEEKLLTEAKDFSYNHYLADLYGDDDDGDYVGEHMSFSPPWDELYKKLGSTSSVNPDDIVHFTSEEKEKFRKLPNKEYLLSKSETQALYYGLVDILFAYAYDKRTTSDDSNEESGWTINKLSSTLSWLKTFTSLRHVVVSCVRRSLIYPLYRHWELAMVVLEDTRKILSLGRKYVLRCLLDIHNIFIKSDPRYILNDLYITDYCVWIQSKSCKTEVFLTLAEALEKVKITKDDVDLEIVEYEQGAKLAIEEQRLAANLPSVSGSPHASPESLRSNLASESPNSTCSVDSLNFSQAKSSVGTIASRLEDICISDVPLPLCATEAGFSESPSSSGSEAVLLEVKCCPASRSDCHVDSRKNQPSPDIVIHMPSSLDPTIQNSDSSSDSGSTSNSCSDTVTDSDDDSTTSDSDSDDSDADSTFSNNSNEHSRLLKKEKSYERRR